MILKPQWRNTSKMRKSAWAMSRTTPNLDVWKIWSRHLALPWKLCLSLNPHIQISNVHTEPVTGGAWHPTIIIEGKITLASTRRWTEIPTEQFMNQSVPFLSILTGAQAQIKLIFSASVYPCLNRLPPLLSSICLKTCREIMQEPSCGWF